MKLDLKELISKLLTSTKVVVDRPSTVAGLITLNSGWSIDSYDVVRCGQVWNIRFAAKYNTAWATNTQLTMGVLTDKYRPEIAVSIDSILTNGVADPSGTIYVRNVSGGTLGANQAVTYCISFMNNK